MFAVNTISVLPLSWTRRFPPWFLSRWWMTVYSLLDDYWARCSTSWPNWHGAICPPEYITHHWTASRSWDRESWMYVGWGKAFSIQCHPVWICVLEILLLRMLCMMTVETMDKVNESNSNIVVLGDFNTDLLKSHPVWESTSLFGRHQLTRSTATPFDHSLHEYWTHGIKCTCLWYLCKWSSSTYLYLVMQTSYKAGNMPHIWRPFYRSSLMWSATRF